MNAADDYTPPADTGRHIAERSCGCVDCTEGRTLAQARLRATRPGGGAVTDLHNIYNPDHEAWKDRALCADPAEADRQGITVTEMSALFFPERGESTRPAKAICAACPVRADCLNYALDNHILHGLWGGFSERARRRMRRTRKDPAA